MRCSRLFLLAFLALTLAAIPALAQEGGIQGRVAREDGSGVGGVTVVVQELSLAVITDNNGSFRFDGVPGGTYSISYSLSDNLATATDILVTAGEVISVAQTVDWEVSFAETITVVSASRRRERIVEAPAAVTVISQETIAREAATGQLAKLLEFTPGASVTQSGIYDFNLNTRGFNSSLNRRVPVIVDGRDPSVPFLGAQEWSTLSFAMDDLAVVELVRGPSSALYGTNAFNGVLNLVTKLPRYSQGGLVRLSGGELSTIRGDVRWAGELGSGFYMKALGSYTNHDDFYRSRNQGGEYPGLPTEAIPLVVEEDEILLGNIHMDKYFSDSAFLTVEVGAGSVEGQVLTTGIGRIQVVEQDRFWIRGNFSTPHFNVMAYLNERDAPQQRSLASGMNLVLDSEITALEVQGNHEFVGGKVQFVGGGSYREEEIDTQGTLTGFSISEDRQALFAQLDWAATDRFKVVVAGRWDDSSLYDALVSPKLALVFAPTRNHTLRLTYNEAFQSPNYSEYFLATAAGAPVMNFGTGFELGAGLPPGTVSSLGFNFIPIMAFGNNDLEVEEIETIEFGYSGILGGKAFLTFDYYNSNLTNFVTDLLPGVNPDYPFYQFPTGYPGALQAGIIQTLTGLNPIFFGLTNLNGGPAVVLSYTNTGEADAQGIDFGLNFYMNSNWTLDFSYSWFDFEIKDEAAGDQILPNTPETKLAAGVTYSAEKFDGSLKVRWSDDFQWAAGVFNGTVPSYETVDLALNYHVTDSLSLGVNVTNLLDDEHYEAFGGDLIGRRALARVQFTW